MGYNYSKKPKKTISKKIDTQFIIINESCLEVVIKDGYAFCVSDLYPINDEKLYESKVEAMCQILLKRLNKGTPLKNFKASPYYNDYLVFLEKDYPEYLI